MGLPQGDVLWFLFQWLWLVWISIICPAGIIFGIIALISSGDRSQRYKKRAVTFGSVAAVWTFVFILLLIDL